MAIELFKHNQTAYVAAKQMLCEKKKAAIIHPTGTGKSFIAFKLCEDNIDKTICWLAPSEYIFKTQIENLQKAANGFVPVNIKFYTYAKLMLLNDADLEEIKPDYIVLDEFHRCGAEVWGKGVQALLSMYEDVPILGLSATAIRYLDNQRDMADELFAGNVASEITLGDAIVRGILNPPKYILSVYSYQKNLEKYEKKVKATRSKIARTAAERYLEALRHALEKAEGLDVVFERHMTEKNGKYIVFCANFEHMQEMIGKVPEWFSKVDVKPHVYFAYSNNPETSQAFSDFKEDKSNHLKLLFCIDMLNEGIHVDDISGVILLRPTISPTIYKQQIGRALSANKSKDAVIFDVVLNIENLYSLDVIEDEMQLALNYYRVFGLEKEIVNEKFTIIDEVKDCLQLFDKLNDTLTASWDLMYKYAEEYYEKNGHLMISSRYRTEDGYSLGQWIFVQRAIRKGQKTEKLTKKQIEKLDKIGMVWESVTDLNWEKNFNAAKKYYEEFGNIDVSARYITKEGIRLGGWIANLRAWARSGLQARYLTDDRKMQLDKLGMIWNKLDLYWERNFAAACQYYQKNGHLNVPTDFISEEGIRLGRWLIEIRALQAGKRQQRTKLSEEQVERLNNIGMIWTDNITNKWEIGIKEAEKYAKKNGTLLVPVTYVAPSGYNLGAWLQRQNKLLRENKLSVERKKQLDSIGVVWIRKDPWMIRYDAVLSYFNEFGTLNISQAIVFDGVWLGKWIIKQKKLYEQNTGLTPNQRALLEKLPLEQVGKRKNDWYAIYNDVFAYYEKNGNIKIPTSVTGKTTGVKLSDWLIRQRSMKKSGELSEEQVNLLDNIGFEWKLKTVWEEGYTRAKEYFERNGNLDMNHDYKCEEDGFALGFWVFDYRKAYNGMKSKCVITPEQIKALEEIGMEWQRTNRKKKEKYDQWESKYNKVVEFYLETGYYPKTTSKEAEEKKMACWLNNQRKSYRNGYLSEKQIEQLSAIGITQEWLDVSPTPFEKGYAVAKAHFDEYGSLNVTRNFQHKSGFWLGEWINKIRNKKAKLSPEQIVMLDAIGFVWEKPTDPFEEQFAEAQAYYQKKGVLPLELKQCETEEEINLCRWLKQQIRKKTKGELSKENIERLTAIGMDWMNSKDRAWFRGFSKAKEYYDTYGNLNVRVSYICPDGYRLGEWLHSQRKHQDQLSHDRIRMLSEIGFKKQNEKND